MIDSALHHFVDEWQTWTGKVLELGVANLGATTALEIESWAEHAAALGYAEDAQLALNALDERLPLAQRGRCFVTSICRMQVASGLLLHSKFAAPSGDTHS
jgi:hypothetical protein